ncbi:hypothetical protein OH687_10435 [Burkholderia anthina]|nr:hypothetical protein OH687_10435 [Burkholderia anthina]
MRFYNLTGERPATGLTLLDVVKNGRDVDACGPFEDGLSWRAARGGRRVACRAARP